MYEAAAPPTATASETTVLRDATSGEADEADAVAQEEKLGAAAADEAAKGDEAASEVALEVATKVAVKAAEDGEVVAEGNVVAEGDVAAEGGLNMGLDEDGAPAGGFPAAHVAERMARRIAPSVAADAPEFMAAVLEVVASQVLQRAGDAAAAGSSGRIEPHHIRVAVRKDEDLTRLVGAAALEQGGLLRPDIEEK